jgi:hypothetical protein
LTQVQIPAVEMVRGALRRRGPLEPLRDPRELIQRPMGARAVPSSFLAGHLSNETGPLF